MNQMANEIKDNFIKGYDCSQVVFRHFAERFDLSEDEANRIAACFGGGMMLGSVCGAYTGALMAIGMKYGHTKEEVLMDQKNVMIGKYMEFKNRFEQEYGSVNCKEIIGYDVSTPEATSRGIRQRKDDRVLSVSCRKGDPDHRRNIKRRLRGEMV